MYTRNERTLIELLNEMLQLFDNKEHKTPKFEELKSEYDDRINEGYASGTEALEASDWWAEQGNFFCFTASKEQARLLKISTAVEYTQQED